MNRLLPLFVLLAFTQGCAGLAESFRTKRQADLRQRAAFELQCPADQLQITPLDQAAASHGGGPTGVTGCGKQATYIWDAYGTGWILNSGKLANAR
ncbi:MAG: hypothetical protein JNJ46_30435 [Myxococcales bacterium]|nr:hypothetical protein [Myxococcales bacterium]